MRNVIKSLIINVDEIKDRPLSIAVSEPADRFESLVRLVKAGECEFLSPLSATVVVEREFDHIRAHGTASTRVRLDCSRCLTGYDADLSSAFTIFYTKASSIPEDEEVELGEEDLISVTYNGHEIDLTPEIEQQVIMELPLKPLCSEMCQGLCPQCGKDLNQDSCSCGESACNFRLSALKNIKIKN